MDGIHDLGGMEGFGPVPIIAGDAQFANIKDWEKRMWGLSRERTALAPDITIDWFRHGIERMVPADYLSFAYFNKWCVNYLMIMIDSNLITLDDVKRGHIEKPELPAAVVSLENALEINRRADISFETEPHTMPSFVLGQTVRTQREMTSKHTRLPRYARDRCGTIIVHHGCHVLPDEGARGVHVGEHLYTVSFAAAELWGPDASLHDTVALDLWESYLVQT